MSGTDYPETPDGRYFVAKARLWRKSNPDLDDETRSRLVKDLMSARRAVRDARDDAAKRAARTRVEAAKRGLGERGPVWWTDGAPDEGQKHPKNTSYAQWWAGLDDTARQRAGG